MVPLATPPRLATRSSRLAPYPRAPWPSRVAASPRAINSSIAASMIASRRSAARSARFDAGFTFGETTLDDLAWAARIVTRLLADRGWVDEFGRVFFICLI